VVRFKNNKSKKKGGDFFVRVSGKIIIKYPTADFCVG